MDQLFVIRQLAGKYLEKNKTLYNNFIDFRQAFDSVWQQGLWQVLRNYGILEELVELLEDMYSKSLSAVRVDGELTECFRVTVVSETRMRTVAISIQPDPGGYDEVCLEINRGRCQSGRTDSQQSEIRGRQ